MSDIVIMRQPGRPCSFFPQGEYAGQLKREKGKMGSRESDGPVVPVKAGNSAGGKGATHGIAE